MGLDIRLPIGSMFTLIGLLLTANGLLTRGSKVYDHSLGFNINLWWGLILLLFGLAMLLPALLKKNK
jgi:hypothetical protein